MPNEAEFALVQKSARRRKARMILGVWVLLCAVPPLVNVMGNPRVAALHGSDIVGLLAAGLCLGFGLACLANALIFRGD